MLINREQQRVIDEVEQNILVSVRWDGKTNTLAYRDGASHRGWLCGRRRISLCMTFYEQGRKRDERPHQSLWAVLQRLWRLVHSTASAFSSSQQEGKCNETLHYTV